MRTLARQEGAALVTALMLTVLALVISLTLLYSVTVGTRASASQKRYRSALSAAHGGVAVVTLELLPQLLQSATPQTLTSDFSLIALELPQYDCLRQKLTLPTRAWSACSPAQSSSDPALAPDVSFRLAGPRSGSPSFRVAAKVVESVPGNSDSAGLDYVEQGSAVAGSDEVVRPHHVPALYSLVVQGSGAGSEKANLSLLYAY